MSSILGQIVVVLLLIVANGVFAMAEIAVLSARKVRLQQQAEVGKRGARAAIDLGKAPNNFLSTIQIGITLIGVFAGAFGGARLSQPLARMLAQIDWLAASGDSIALAIVVLIITYLSLVIGELVPKRLALNNPEATAMALAVPMQMIGMISRPMVKLLGASTDLVLRLLRVRPSSEPSITEEEIEAILEQGTQAGALEAIEEDMVKRVLLLDDRRANALMTPRRDVAWLDINESMDEIRKQIASSPFSRFPVADDDLDHVVGELLAKDLLTHGMPESPRDLCHYVREPLYVAEVMPALDVLGAFRKAHTEMAFVIDEYGSVQGLITLDDIFEAIVGDVSSLQAPGPGIVPRDDGTWLVDGLLPVDEFKEAFGIDTLPGEDQGFYQTVAGFLTMRLGRIPSEADRIECKDYAIEVIDMDGPRVDKVLFTPRMADDLPAIDWISELPEEDAQDSPSG